MWEIPDEADNQREAIDEQEKAEAAAQDNSIYSRLQNWLPLRALLPELYLALEQGSVTALDSASHVCYVEQATCQPAFERKC
jgi:hypothetical protein